MSDDPSPEALREAGQLAEAAQAYRRRGELGRAEKLFADLWDFRAAAEVARERGDRTAELGHLLSAKDSVAAAEVARVIEQGSELELRRGAEVFERHRCYLEAAGLRERLGELPAARELYRRAHAFLEVARLERALGRLREAGLAYEQLLSREPEGADASRSRLELAQLLLSLDRPEEAIAHLQRALPEARANRTRPIYEELIVALAGLGYLAAADEIHAELAELVPSVSTRSALVERHRPSGASGPTRLGGRYEIERLLGAGASGRVFLARDAISGRAVAVKALVSPLERRAQESWSRFFAEARLVGSLRHPNLVEILDVDEVHGLVVMEHVAGGTLYDRLPAPGKSAPPLDTALVRRMLLDTLDALAAVHARGVVHRDLKPANLFFTRTGEVKLGDFGAAHLFSEEVTQTAGFIGTLAYMAPEQISGGTIDFAADLYALGAVAFHALTGRLPFPGPDFVAQHLGDRAPPPSFLRPGLAPGWDRLIGQLLEKNPRARATSLDATRREVERLATDREATETAAMHADTPADPTSKASPRYVARSPLPDGTGGPMTLGVDTWLGRAIVLQTLLAPYVATQEGARHLAWLRDFARGAGPRVQRIYALTELPDGSVELVFEAPSGTAPAADQLRARRRLAASLATLHRAGVAHGSIESSIVEDAHGQILLLAGRAPLLEATVAKDRAVLGVGLASGPA